MKAKGHLILSGFLTMAFCGSFAVAQITTAQIQGTVRDTSQGVLPGVTINVTNVETGVSRTTLTDSNGRYHVPNLTAGDYRVRAALPGFQTSIREGITLTIGRHAVVDLELSVGEIEEEIVVRGEAPLVNTQRAGLSVLTDGTTIRELPVNGRDFLRLALLDAGTVPVTYRTEISKGLGLQLALNGARPTMTGYLLDGSNIKTTQNFQTPGGAAGVLLGVDAIREFEVLSNGFSAEYGNAAGGIVNAVTRSGTNEFHGSAYWFHRNEALDARNFFDTEKPPLTRHQFGGTFGGPIVRDRTFFFANYERVQQDLGLTTIMNVPTADTRAGNLPDGVVEVDPGVVPYLDLWPLPNGRDFGDGTGEYIFSHTYPTRESFFMTRVDQQLGREDQIYFRYSIDDATSLTPKGTNPNNNFGVANSTRTHYFSTEYNKILGTTSLNMLRFSFNRSFREGTNEMLTDVDPALTFVPGEHFGLMRIPGLTDPGVDGKYPRNANLDVFELHEHFSLIRGPHSMKMGFQWGRYHDDNFGFTRIGGEYRFRSIAHFLRADARRLQLPGPGSDSTRRWRSNLFAFFFQDDFQVAPRLTLNLGVRYEFITVPTEVDGKIANLRDVVNDPTTTVGEPFFENPSLGNVAPRVGFAWDPIGDGKTSLRGGFGIYFEQLHLGQASSAGNRNEPFYFDVRINGPLFPDAVASLESIPPAERLTSPNPVQFEAEQPTIYQFHLAFEREIMNQTVLTLAYAGSRGVNLLRLLEFNNADPTILPDGRPFFPEDLERRNPNFDTIELRTMDGNSYYHSGQIKVSRRLSSGFLFKGSYTFSKSIDDSSNGIGASDYTYPTEIPNWYTETAWRGLSEFDARHSLSLNAVYRTPTISGGKFTRALLGGWQIGSILNLRSGTPFPVKIAVDQARNLGKDDTQVPDLLPGADNNPVNPGNPDQYFDPSVFTLPEPGFFGNLGRNTVIGPGLVTFDLAFFKNYPLRGEKGNLQFRLEMFNIFNRANFENPVDNIWVFDDDGPINSAGRIVATTTTARQIQLGLKFTF